LDRKINDTERICKKDAARVAELAAKKYKPARGVSRSNAGSNANVALGIESSTSKSGTNLMVKSSKQILPLSPASNSTSRADNAPTIKQVNSEDGITYLKPSEMSDSPKQEHGSSRVGNVGGKVFNNTFKSTVMDTVEEVRFDSRLSN